MRKEDVVVGAKVKMVRSNGWVFDEGDILTVVEGGSSYEHKLITLCSVENSPNDFELVPHTPFDLNVTKWFIFVATDTKLTLVKEWLKDRGVEVDAIGYSCGVHITNSSSLGLASYPFATNERTKELLGRGAVEIKFDFDTKVFIKDVHWPELETPEQKKIKELRETIEKAQKQLEELEGLHGGSKV